jgi:hypothetical protein
MSPAEKAARHSKLYKVVTTHTSHSWASILVKQLLGQLGRQEMARQTPYIPKEQLQRLYASAKKRLFLLDYDVSVFRFFTGECLLILMAMRSLGHPCADSEDAIDGCSFGTDIRSTRETFERPE